MAKKKKNVSRFVWKYDPKTYSLKTAKFHVSKVVDGDTMKGTIILRSWGRSKTTEAIVQLLGVNTPDLHVMDAGKEPENYAIEAMHLSKQVEGKTVSITFAVTHAGNSWIRESQMSSFRWSEQRLLAIVYPKKGKESLNATLLRKGYAHIQRGCEWMSSDFGRKLSNAYTEARRKQRGMWKGQALETENEGISTEQVIVYCLLSFIAGFIAAAILIAS